MIVNEESCGLTFLFFMQIFWIIKIFFKKEIYSILMKLIAKIQKSVTFVIDDDWL